MMTETKSGYAFAVLGWFCGLVILSVIGTVAYWVLDTSPPIVDIHTKFLKWDEERPNLLWISRSGVRVRQCPGKVHRWLIGRAVVQLPEYYLPYPHGTPLGPFQDEVAVEVPEWETSITSYRANVYYACNPIQRLIPLTVIIPDVPIPPRKGDNGNPNTDPPRDTTG